MNEPWWERPVCILCDYGLVILALMVVLGVGLWRLSMPETLGPPVLPTVSPTLVSTLPTLSTPVVEEPTQTSVASTNPAPTITPTAQKPEFILVFIPVRWQSSMSKFREEARKQADLFITESQMDLYFEIKVAILDEGLSRADLSNSDLELDVEEYGIINFPGDRYIGITDGDLVLNGNSTIAGWTTFNGAGIIAESGSIVITAHELGHTFGLCDEYSYPIWLEQDAFSPNGCPNPYPASCPKDQDEFVHCNGEPTTDGRNSIMGPAGMPGEYGYNDSCKDHLLKKFLLLSGQGLE